MKKIMFLLFFISCLELYAQFDNINITKIKNIEGIVNPEMNIDLKYSKSYTNIWMNVYINQSIKEVNAYDYSKQIEVKLRKVFDTQFDGDINVDRKFEFLNIRKLSNAYEFSNYNGYMRIARWGENYDISGNVKDENGKYKYVNLTLFKRFSDEFSFAINSSGITLYFDKYSINGNFDENVYTKKTVAYIISSVLAVYADNISSDSVHQDRD